MTAARPCPVPGTQASPWNVGGSLDVGQTSTGTLNIGAAGIVNNTTGVIGSNSGGNGTVTVDGAWNNSASLTIGLTGTGHLNRSRRRLCFGDIGRGWFQCRRQRLCNSNRCELDLE